MRIRSRLLLYLLSFNTLILVLGISVQAFSHSVFSNYLYGTVSEIFNATVSAFTNAVSNVEQLSLTVFSDQIVQDFLKEGTGTRSDFSSVWRRERLTQQLSFYTQKNPYVQEILLEDLNGNRYFGNIGAFDNPRYVDLIDPADIARIDLAKGRSVWIQTGSELMPAALCRQVNTIGDFSRPLLGHLYILTAIDQLLDETISQIGYYEVKTAIQFKGDPFYSSFSREDRENIISRLENRRYSELIFYGEKHFAALVDTGDNSWEFLFLIPVRELFQKLNRINRITYSVFFFIFAVFALLIIQASKQLASPIIALSHEMKTIDENDFVSTVPLRLPPGTSEEVSLLYYEFYQMLEKIDILVNKNLKQQLSINQSQLEALSYQLNPHFLYNTLDSMYWLAQMKSQPEMAEMTRSLSSLLRSSLERSGPLISVKEQLDLLNDYFYIQKIRLKEKLEYQIDVDHKLYPEKIPRFTLQPLVENSIKYCLTSDSAVCRLELSIRRKGKSGGIEIRIGDNGPGLADSDKEILGTGIGLDNLRKRIGLIYGNDAHLKLGRGKLGGVEVIINIPGGNGETADSKSPGNGRAE